MKNKDICTKHADLKSRLHSQVQSIGSKTLFALILELPSLMGRGDNWNGNVLLLVAFSGGQSSLVKRAPSTRMRIFLNPQLFLSGYGFRPYASGEFGSESGYIF